MSTFLEVNPDARSTWVNHPRPSNFPEFEAELLALGGRHPNGRQMLTLDWAPECRHVRLGQMRHSYVDDRIPCRRVEKSLGYQVKRIGSNEAWRYVDHTQLDQYGPEYMALVAYESEIMTVAWQRFVVRQYIPPERMNESPAAWERRRYRHFTPPETNVRAYGDDIGPYPAEGQYGLLLVVQAPSCADYFDYAGTYRAPDRDVLEQLRGALSLREEHHDNRSLEQRNEDDFRAAEEKDEEWRRQVDDNVGAALGWHGKENRQPGDAFVSQFNPVPANKGANRNV